MEIYKDVSEALSKLITEQVATNFDTLYGYIFPIWSTLVVIYLVIEAWAIIYGQKEMLISEFIQHLLVISVVTVFMGASSMYVTEIVPFVMKSGEQIAAGLTGSEGGNSIDAMINQIINLGELIQSDYADKSGFSISGTLIFAVKMILLMASGGLFVLYAASYLIMAKMMVGILLSLGGIFIAFAVFPATRQMFTAWVGSCFNYIFLNIGYAILFSIMIKYLNEYIGKNTIEIQSNVWEVFSIALVFGIGIFLLQQVATLMSILTGGVGINGLVGAVNGFAKTAAQATGLSKAANVGTGLAGKGASLAGRGAMNMASSGLRSLMNKGKVKGG
ncbi:type IV secretion system protein [Arsenophonus nasoniae]|uniref:Type IV secretion system protein n=1 Tax=Arsenophonus nasoniae TaxID=638 RepID=A0AA95KC67_9GAMM|nr:type IV secretion system protein [Arsenophonus nasoniae]WGM03936.1 type IV secretion system protein [Arsenophonus nasoniae]WGM09132.1 type IV secretion system protein [Arsenophonus nasoniae]